jgi:hypothetical protein
VTNALFSQWLVFEAALAGRVKNMAGTALTFSAGRQRIPGYPVDGFRADAALTDGHSLLAVEVEVRQSHPDTNVGKYWLLREYRAYDRVVLVHVYTPAYNSYGWRKALGEFYAKRMTAEGRFEYILMDERGAQDAASTLDAVTERVKSVACDVFGADVLLRSRRPAAADESGALPDA